MDASEKSPKVDPRFENVTREGNGGLLPILPVRNTLLFPSSILTLTIGRESSLKLVEEAGQNSGHLVGVVAQRDESVDNPLQIDLFAVGTMGSITRQIRLKEGNLAIVIQGVRRFRLKEVVQSTPYMLARVEPLPDIPLPGSSPKIEALKRNIEGLFQRIVQLSQGLSGELLNLIGSVEDESKLTDLIVSMIPSFSLSLRQEFLETTDVYKRLEKLHMELTREVEILEMKSKIQNQVESEVSKNQKDYYLREQLKAIQRELGEDNDSQKEVDELRESIEKAGLTEEAQQEAIRELKRLAKMSPASAEYTVSKTYLDWIVSLPWSRGSQKEIDLSFAREILDRDHDGLKEVKERILEYLAVLKIKPDGKAPILCFAGPPGVGKTSLGKSIADALGRKFIRISLGGIRDEAEIRGHRRTYIGALPGQVIQGLRRAGERNPVFMLDEVDKIGMDFRGDPASALLEVLDPEQNHSFRDHYLDLAFDLSKVLFITTANVLDTIPRALLDRMEVIELHGYTEEEKTRIARNHLLPRQSTENGLSLQTDFSISDETIRTIIRYYTREAGLRNLEREIAKICRKLAKLKVEGQASIPSITVESIPDWLGVPHFFIDEEIDSRTSVPGVAVGLAWTPTGGDVLFVEASRMKGEKKIEMTGQLGNVMQESVKAALTWVRAHATELGIPEDFYQQSDIHLHVPAGAIPKDGPSAGVTMVSTLVSLLTKRVVKPRLAMTGEITLSGKVLPVGGIKEKVLAAHRFGIKEIILPKENSKSLKEDLPREVLENMKFHFAGDIYDVLDAALGIRTRVLT